LNIHALLEDHSINTDNLPIKIVNFNGVGIGFTPGTGTPKRVRGGMTALHPTEPFRLGLASAG
jgi:hypothetical protein